MGERDCSGQGPPSLAEELQGQTLGEGKVHKGHQQQVCHHPPAENN